MNVGSFCYQLFFFRFGWHKPEFGNFVCTIFFFIESQKVDSSHQLLKSSHLLRFWTESKKKKNMNSRFIMFTSANLYNDTSTIKRQKHLMILETQILRLNWCKKWIESHKKCNSTYTNVLLSQSDVQMSHIPLELLFFYCFCSLEHTCNDMKTAAEKPMLCGTYTSNDCFTHE